jgi:hypothetical protein
MPILAARARFSSVSSTRRVCIKTADAAQRCGRQYTLRRVAYAEVNIDAGLVGVSGVNDAGDIAIGDQADRSAGFAHGADQIGVARPIEDHGGNCFGFDAFGLGKIDNVLFGWRVEIDDIVRVTRPHRYLVHVDIRRVEERSVLGQSKGCDSTRHILGAQRGALERVDGYVHFRPRSGADFLADEQHRCFIHLAFADHDRSVDRQFAQFAAHGIDRGLIGFLLGAPAAQSRGSHRRTLGHPHNLERQCTLKLRRLTDRLRRHQASSNAAAKPLSEYHARSIRITCGLP